MRRIIANLLLGVAGEGAVGAKQVSGLMAAGVAATGVAQVCGLVLGGAGGVVAGVAVNQMSAALRQRADFREAAENRHVEKAIVRALIDALEQRPVLVAVEGAAGDGRSQMVEIWVARLRGLLKAPKELDGFFSLTISAYDAANLIATGGDEALRQQLVAALWPSLERWATEAGMHPATGALAREEVIKLFFAGFRAAMEKQVVQGEHRQLWIKLQSATIFAILAEVRKIGETQEQTLIILQGLDVDKLEQLLTQAAERLERVQDRGAGLDENRFAQLVDQFKTIATEVEKIVEKESKRVQAEIVQIRRDIAAETARAEERHGEGMDAHRDTHEALGHIRELIDQLARPPRGERARWTVPQPSAYFTGQEQALQSLQQALTNGVAGLWGMGGIGKTEIALAYACRRAKEDFDEAHLVRATSLAEMDLELARLMVPVGGEEPKEAKTWVGFPSPFTTRGR